MVEKKPVEKTFILETGTISKADNFLQLMPVQITVG